MGLRDLLVLAIVFGSLPVAFRRPYWGLLLFSWLGYMRVQDLAWAIDHYRLSFLVAAVLFGGFLLFEWGKRPAWLPDLRCRLIVLLLGLVGLSALLPAGAKPGILDQYVQLVKIVAVALITTSLVDTRARLRGLLLVIGLSLGFFGLKGGVFLFLGGGQIQRGPGGFIQDNNDFSLALVMALPLLLYGSYVEKDRRLVWLLRGTAAGCVGTIGILHSRGGYVALAVTVAVMVWNSRRRALGFVLALVALVAVSFAFPSTVWERLASIRDYKSDTSSMGRLRAWGVALRMIRDKPILGVGFWNFQDSAPLYDPTMSLGLVESRSIVAHNSYFQIWAECGSIAFAAYPLLFYLTFRDLRRLRRYADAGRLPPWVGSTARGFSASLAGFMIGAVFLNRGHFDLAYHLVGAAIAFSAIAWREGAPSLATLPGAPGVLPRRAAFRPLSPAVRPAFRGGAPR